MRKLCSYPLIVAVWAFCMVTASPAQTFQRLLIFNLDNGGRPWTMTLAQGRDGDFYGTTNISAANSFAGTIFRVTSAGTLTTLYTFCSQSGCTDGEFPTAGLVLATDGNFYGTTNAGGADSKDCQLGCGTIFKVTPDGTLTTLHSFNMQDGFYPETGLIQATDGNFYGTTPWGGVAAGTVYKITPKGVFTTVYNFHGGDGSSPWAGLVEGTDGKLYGATRSGGAYGGGTIFQLTRAGKLTTLYNFCAQSNCTDGFNPVGTLTQAADGNLYGTTYEGGDPACQPPYGCGTVFRITPKGKFTTLHTFEFTDGAQPGGGLLQATDGNLYGMTHGSIQENYCADPGCGTIFRITPAGALKMLHKFAGADGASPFGGLLQATTGSFYGAPTFGGPYKEGVIFNLDMGFAPFAGLVSSSGKVGKTVGILGQGFTGTTNLTFGGTPAGFKVISDTFINATVPDLALTGIVTVTTPGGALTSNRLFRVTPQLLSFSPTSGPVGTQVIITGVSLTQTQLVGFGNRVPAQFTVNSDLQVTGTVPAGAKTGRIIIETQGGTAKSSGTFTVTP